ncbi:MAG: phospho-N-acetylmuramoyl-pentapeptide-transferase [Ruminococcaceae bacterium]|nr:phospho-N-acetylmuramoyl-pentapeptide-transferase [Oscillospiraceae bacterium]
MIIYFLAAMIATFVLTAIFARILIPKLKSMKLGQQILDIGPRWHKNKEGTPTMGGISFILASLIVFIILAVVMTVNGASEGLEKLIIVMVMATLNGAIGIIDDLTKFKNHRNEGLTASQKYLLQLVTAGLFLGAMKFTGNLTTAILIPFAGIELELGIFYYILSILLITGIINAVNLTDGIDGLASSVTLAVGAFFAVAAFTLGLLPEAVISGITIGACLGFLVYNFYPARVFMGDTGSLFLGGLVIGMAYMVGNPLIIVIVGIVYICEAASVMIQVGYFKITHGKRFFKMAPIHHHFEKCGWSELKVVGVFSLVTVIAGVIAYFGIK